MFVLFLVMNGDFDSVQEILDAIPSTQLACALFMILSNWAILAIFTAVVSENMITTVEDRRRENDDVENKDKTDRSVVKLPLVRSRVLAPCCACELQSTAKLVIQSMTSDLGTA